MQEVTGSSPVSPTNPLSTLELTEYLLGAAQGREDNAVGQALRDGRPAWPFLSRTCARR
jgi:hypothetical protein